MTELYCVLHKSPAWPREKTAAFLAAELCVTRPEAEEIAGKSPGFLLQDASLAKAAAFNMRASAYGFETMLLSQLDLNPPPTALTVSKMELETAGFYYTAGAARERLAFDAVRAAAACAFSVEVPPADPGATLRDSLTGLAASLRARYFPLLPMAPDSPRPAAPPAKETIFSADILAANLRLSLACDEQDYSGLGPGKSLSSFENFRALLAGLAASAPKAERNGFLDAFLKKESVSRLKHPSRAAYEKELVWLSTIAAEKPKA
jgi:hypothetical protein